MPANKTSKRPSAAGAKVAQGSRIATTTSSKTGTPRLERNASTGVSRTDDVRTTYAKRTSEAPAPEHDERATSSVFQRRGNKSISRKEGAPSASTSKSKKQKPAKRKGLSRRFLIGSLIVVLVLSIATGLVAWNQWFRFDDTQDIQGTWVVEGTSDAITITDTDIVMTEEVSYPYTLDTFQKTISFSFKQYNGSGSYAFSPERTTLIITETDADTGEKVSTKLVKQ